MIELSEPASPELQLNGLIPEENPLHGFLLMGTVSETDSTILPTLFTEAEMNLICAGIPVFFFLLTPLVWTMSECEALPVVPLSEFDTQLFH